MNNQTEKTHRPRFKIKLHQVVNPHFRAAFDKLGTDPAVVDPKREAWPLARSGRQMSTAADDFATVKRNTAKRIGTPIDGDEKNGFTIPNEKQQEWLETLTPILEQDIEIRLDHPVLIHDPLPEASALDEKDLQVLLASGLIEEFETPAVIVLEQPVQETVAAPATPAQAVGDANQRQTGAEAGAAPN